MAANAPTILSAEELRAAHDRIRPHVHRTPVLTCGHFDRRFDAQIHFKCENFQKVGAFKLRGATNAVLSLSKEEVARGLVADSSGNHGQALALAARLRGAQAWVVMPTNATATKVAAVRGYGAEVIPCAPTAEDRRAETERVLRETGGTLVHPFNDLRVIAGQATAAMELLEEVPELDLLLAPVGGGGLLSGTALAAHHFAPRTRVVGVEPAAADDADRSLAAGRILPAVEPHTIADGLLTSLGELTFTVIRALPEGIVTVTEEAIVDAMRLVWERMKIVIEPSAAVPVAALLEEKLEVRGLRLGIILSGGNVDLDRLPWHTS
ncbi:MAG: threonine/serine dehydratase [Thermoanaerobaculia bacterium]